MKSMRDVVIVDGLRTAVGKWQGTLAMVNAETMAARLLLELIERNKLDPDTIDLCLMGNVDNHSNSPNLGRLALLQAGLPHHIAGYSVEHQCGSSLAAVNVGYMHIATGNADIVCAGGAENMSNLPYWIENARQGFRLDEKGLKLHCEFMETARRVCGPELYPTGINMGLTAENLADRYSISRREQDDYALRSQTLAAEAQRKGRFKAEIMPLEVDGRNGPTLFDTDEYIKSDTTLESLASLRATFKKDGTVTAGNASGMNDGASAVLMMTREKALELDLKAVASIGEHTNVGCDPAVMGISPAYAIRNILKKAGTSMDDYGLFEVNEAFAAQTLAVLKELGVTGKRMERFNVNGGAIALGHPLGASGTRLVITLLEEMKLRGVKRGIAGLCCGGGTGVATEFILED
ncbi:MAG: thiolase family protein [Desulfovibrio sp.]|jgi:acetyl-CoA C-acetyltransferase|nr:thiolase family protein [Desulfovibrio sp.]